MPWSRLILRGALLAALVSTAAHARDVVISGLVRDQDTLEPIEGALVTLQATGIRTESASDGTYELVIPDGLDAVIVAAHKGYYHRPRIYEGKPTGFDLLLEAVPQDDDPAYSLVRPTTCGTCHGDQYEQWNGSPMQRGGLNTWLHDIYNGDGTAGGQGGFVYTRDSMFHESNPNSECAACHQPESWIAEPFSRMEGPSDPGYPSIEAVHGVSCDVCHKVAHVDVDRINYPGIFAGAVEFTRPAGPDHLQVEYGVLGDVDYESPWIMRASYQPQLVAEVCGACHQDKNDPSEDHTFDGVISEPTYVEWAESPYGDVDSPLYATCVDCHMPPYGATEVCLILFPPLIRDPDTIRSHEIRGTTPEYLENAAELEIDTWVEDGRLRARVDVTNSQTGHHLPTGVTVRNMILLVEASRVDDGLALESIGTQVVHDLGGIGDPAQGYYAGLPGKYFSKVNHDASGAGPTFFTDAAGIVFDNRIPALQTDSSTYAFVIPPDGGEFEVRARLIYRRAFRFLVDAKQWTQDGHGNPLADITPPHFGHLMESAGVAMTACGGADLDGDLQVGVTDLLAILGAWGECDGCGADLDGDGAVSIGDLLLVLSTWGPCP